MKVLLISANQYTQPHPVYPLGLDYVAGAIGPDHVVEVLDLNALNPSESLFETIDDFSPDIIGLSIRNIDNTDVSSPQGFIAAYGHLVDAIRTGSRKNISGQNGDKVPLVLGGSGFTLFPRELMASLDADYGIIGEGERFGLLVDCLTKGKDPSTLPGIITAKNEGTVPIPWQGNIADHFNPNRPHLSYYLKNGGILNLQTKRGCRYRCIYCTYPYIEGDSPRLFDPDDIARSARQLQAAGAKYLFITDSTFNSEMDHTLAVAEAFKQAAITIPWGAFFAPMVPAGDYFKQLADAGLTHVEFGTESLSDKVLKTYRKPFKQHHVLAAHQAALDAGLHVAHYFLLGGPGETPDTVAETLDRADQLEKCALFVFCGMRIYPHTELHRIATAEGRICPTDSLMAPVFYQNPAISEHTLMQRVNKWADGHDNRIVGAGGEEAARIISRLYSRGFSGPLWEYLIR